MDLVVVGYGRAGQQHIAALSRSDTARLHSILETDVTVTTGDTPRAASWESVLTDPAVDAVSLCLPPGGRADLACAALAAGKAVLLEKPPATTLAELSQVEAAAVAAGRPAAVMLQHRHVLPAAALRTSWGPTAAATLLVSRPRTAAHFSGWRADPGRALGGIVAHLGVHYLDIACQLLGMPVSVTITDRAECHPGIDLQCTGVITFDSQATLAFTVTARAGARGERLSVVGDPGHLDIADGAVDAQIDGQRIRTEPVPGPELRRRVIDELAADTPPDRSSLRRSRGVTRLLELTAAVPAR
ncbi:Gfo/Idh/MocA family oxidoreductase [Micromonospora sp. PLK6-60]|uniref:Gfo/Idh/MocA family protein n=1 Tax=Micromonospora sp. PLK6-60 TaxID=2873383 RepID=UPI001CA67F11|nr:Gfo/Idh/MocA family oxidoreductase [Micromonospora sp. PLK6-60]MBY8870650.1 Gfo/Idh/MocA family oxidoreductase [Micromonospora sp. PLK6-60]